MGEGQVALITGGASGIGRALADTLAARGVTVVLADLQLALAESAAAEIRSRGQSALALALDVRDRAAFARAVQATTSRYGRIDYFFNNAGILVGGPVERYEASDWSDVLDVNLMGVVNGIQAVYPVMISQGFGHIINTASMAGLLPAASMVSYTASKHAVVGLSKALRIEAKRHGVRVSVLCPGFIRTPILTGGKFGRMRIPGFTEARGTALFDRIYPMDAAKFAVGAVAAVERNEPIIVLPHVWKLFWAIERISPRLNLAIWSFTYERLMREMDSWVETGDKASAHGNGQSAARGNVRLS
jgi:NAD(P)-dependent dehydrogenase (short-subunit alcohol dehydrogenase family)